MLGEIRDGVMTTRIWCIILLYKDHSYDAGAKHRRHTSNKKENIKNIQKNAAIANLKQFEIKQNTNV